jgi:predicted DNA-binding protein (MmcQ/YjbR family)
VPSYFDQVRQLCLAYPGAYEDNPWGDGPVFKNARGKIFVFTSGDRDPFGMTVKLTHEEQAEALNLPFVRVAAYVGRHGWVTVTIPGEFEWEVALPWIARSYDLVSGAAKRAARP